MMNDYEYIYKAAIALNNTGVYLIQHGRYAEAIETFKDAIRCTKESFFSNGMMGVEFPRTMLQRTDYEQSLQAAWNRKSMAHLGEFPMPRKSILIVSDQDDPTEVYAALEQNQRSMTFCCVTIDPIEKFDICDVDRLQLESALIVYNFGIAFRCIANHPNFRKDEVVRSIPHSEAFFASVRIMELTRCVTSNLLRMFSSRRVQVVNVPPNLLLTMLLVATNLFRMSEDSYLLRDNQEYYKFELQSILATISDRRRFFIAEGYQKSVAAAA